MFLSLKPSQRAQPIVKPQVMAQGVDVGLLQRRKGAAAYGTGRPEKKTAAGRAFCCFFSRDPKTNSLTRCWRNVEGELDWGKTTLGDPSGPGDIT